VGKVTVGRRHFIACLSHGFEISGILLELGPGCENRANSTGIVRRLVKFQAGGTLIAEDEQVIGNSVEIRLH
jgi:hypothetical protein